MLTDTLKALQAFDNSHDFERMAADILNGLGYADVEPMAPAGGSDSGQDIRFRADQSPGVAFVTLDKGISGKFKDDLGKQAHTSVDSVIALFCNVAVSPSQKQEFAKLALAKGYRLEVYDLERLRSLLDSSLKEIRRRYLKVDDELSTRLRADVTRLVRFPAATSDSVTPPTVIEALLANPVPRRVFELLLQYEDSVIAETPTIGTVLIAHRAAYYKFREDAVRVEHEAIAAIRDRVAVAFPHGWRIYLLYAMQRFAGLSRDQVVKRGDFLNYGITWDDTERVFVELSQTPLATQISALFRAYQEMEAMASQLE